MNLLLRKINSRTEWINRVKDHVSTFPTSTHLSLISSGFPDDWLTQPIWK